jgi:hypothetical protein
VDYAPPLAEYITNQNKCLLRMAKVPEFSQFIARFENSGGEQAMSSEWTKCQGELEQRVSVQLALRGTSVWCVDVYINMVL